MSDYYCHKCQTNWINQKHCPQCNKPPPTIFTEASALINGDRREAYGSVEESFARVAATWSGLLQRPVTPQQVALCMIALKLHREAHKPGHDNRVDIMGYTGLLEQLYTSKPAIT